MTETALAHAFTRAGVDTSAARLYALAVERLRGAGLDVAAAAPDFAATVFASGGLLAALIGREASEAAALSFLTRVAAEMRDPASAGAAGRISGSGDGQTLSSRRTDAAAAAARGHRQVSQMGQPNDSARQISRLRPGEGDSPTIPERDVRTLPPRSLDGGAGHCSISRKGRGMPAPPPSTARGRGDKIPAPARGSAAIPPARAPRGLAEMRAIQQVAPTIFDTRKFRDGTPLGDLRYSQLDRFIADNAQEAALLRLVRDLGVPDDRNARIRDYVDLETMQRFLQRAAAAAP